MSDPQYDGKSIWLIALRESDARSLLDMIGPEQAAVGVKEKGLEPVVTQSVGNYESFFIGSRIDPHIPSPLAGDDFDGIVFNMLRGTAAYAARQFNDSTSQDSRLPAVAKAAILYKLKDIAAHYADSGRRRYWSARVLANARGDFDDE